MAASGFGPVVLIGSGETSATGGQIFDAVARRLSGPLRISILETPAGFELNSAQVAGKVADFLNTRLQNQNPEISVIAARQRGSPFSPDDPDVTRAMLSANLIYMGAGSPTYAIRQLQGSLAWETLVARQRLGAALVFASAGAIAVGRHALPIYEIYKAGHDPHWVEGLDLLGAYGLNLAIVSHWNNNDGGADIDTSRCFLGKSRFDMLHSLLPADVTVIGVDEHSGLVMDVAAERAGVLGVGGVTILTGGREHQYGSEAVFDLDRLGPFRLPSPRSGIRPAILEQAREANRPSVRVSSPSNDVMALVEEREAARSAQNWAASDRLRERIAALGWRVLDTHDGPRLERTR